jgi:uncharacterized phage-like protein YoqJ
MKIAVTGHRPGKLGNEWEGIGYYSDKIRSYLQSIINQYYEDNQLTLITGMALGVDMIWAELAIDNDLPFIAAIPCIGHEMKWSNSQQTRYHLILNHPLCDKRIITPSMYNPSVMQVRNEWMVDACDLLVGVWDGSSGGTANCVNYAMKHEKKLVLMNPDDIA